MKKNLLFLPLLLPSLAAVAQVEPYMVREDRIWTYEWTKKHDRVLSTIDLQFSGTTEIDGEVYSNLYARKAGTPLDPANNMLLAYAREEDGKVYIYNDGSLPDLSTNSPFKDEQNDNYTPHFCEFFYNTDYPEALIYDFGLEAGESYSLYPQEFAASTYVESHKETPVPWSITDKDHFVLADGTSVPAQSIKTGFINVSGSLFDLDITAIAGLGDMDNVWPYPSIRNFYWNGLDAPRLLKLTDTDGNVLFERPSAVASVGEAILRSAASETGRYTIDGRRMSAKAKGWCIIRYSDGSARKVYIK